MFFRFEKGYKQVTASGSPKTYCYDRPDPEHIHRTRQYYNTFSELNNSRVIPSSTGIKTLFLVYELERAKSASGTSGKAYDRVFYYLQCHARFYNAS